MKPAKLEACSVLTALRCFKSLLLPTRVITTLSSECSLNSLNHFSKFSNVENFDMSNTNIAPKAPL